MTPAQKKLLCDAIPPYKHGRPTDRHGNELPDIPELGIFYATESRWVDEHSDDEQVIDCAAHHCERDLLVKGADRAAVEGVLVTEARAAAASAKANARAQLNLVEPAKLAKAQADVAKFEADADAELAAFEQRIKGAKGRAPVQAQGRTP